MSSNKVQKIRKSQYIRLLSYAKPRSIPYAMGIVGDSLIGIGFRILMAFIMKYMVDAAIKGDMALLINAGLMVCAGAFVLNILSPIFRYLADSCGEKTVNDVIRKVFRHIVKLPVSYFDKHHSGDLLSRLNNDVGNMSQVYQDLLGGIVFVTLNSVGCIGAVLILDWRLGLIAITFGILSALVNMKFAKPFYEVSKKKFEHMGKLSEKLIDIVAGFNTMKMFHMEEKLLDSYRKCNNEIVKLSVKRGKAHSIMESAISSMNHAAFVLIIAVGAYLVLKKQLTFGTVIAVVHLLGNITGVFTRLGSFYTYIKECLAGAVRIFEIIDEDTEPEKYESNLADNVAGALSKSMIEFRNVRFSYSTDECVLNDISFLVDEGNMAALAGSSGGGKSTIVKLLLGFYPWQSGSIYIAGREFSKYTIDELRSLIAYVPQDPYLFDGSIEDNIRYGKLNATREEIEMAAKAANAHEFILEQPEGYTTQVGEKGVRLSGGQKQRLSIARAVLKNAPILLLDEATSSLDSENEQLVQDALNRLMKGRTTIAIAHRLSTIEKADVIYVIDNGKVIENGSHKDLLSLNGVYSTLYQMQFNEQSESSKAS